MVIIVCDVYYIQCEKKLCSVSRNTFKRVRHVTRFSKKLFDFFMTLENLYKYRYIIS